jgi:polysaccharide biosynthesis transport protein
MSSNPFSAGGGGHATSDSGREVLAIRPFLRTLWQGRWIILITSAVALFLGFRYVQTRGTIWEVTSRLYIENPNSGMLTADGLLVSSDSRNHVNTQAELILSTSVLKGALSRPEIASCSIFTEVHNRFGWLKRNLHVGVGQRDDIVTVSLESPLVAEACSVVNATVDAYREFHASRKKTTVKELLLHLSKRIEEHEEEFDRRLEDLTAFLRVNGTLGLDRGGEANFELSELRDLSSALLEARSEERGLRERRQLAESLVETPDVLREFLDIREERRAISSRSQEANSTHIVGRQGALADRVRDLEIKRSRLLTDRTAEHPTILALDDQLTALRQQGIGLEAEIATADDRLAEIDGKVEAAFVQEYLGALEQQWELAVARVEDLAAQAESQRQLVQDLGGQYAEYRLLNTRVEQQRTILEDLTKSINQLNLANVSENEESALSIEVLDPASIDTATVTVSRTRTLAVFAFLGLVLGYGLSWLRSAFDHRLRTTGDVTVDLGLPLLTTTPRLRLRPDEADAIEQWDENPTLAEAVRSLRTGVYFGLPASEGKVIQVTSPAKGDGKSTISAQLGIAMAQAGQRTLLIDADLRSPTQHRLFHFDNEAGLADVLADGASLSETVHETRIEKLHVLTSGPIPPKPAEMLNSRALGDVLAAASEEYDRILIDSPPVLAVADSRVVANQCDVTVLVLRAEKTTRKQVTAAGEQLASVGAKILGAVLNAMPSGFGSGYGADYGYGYGRDSERSPSRRGRSRSTPSSRKG